MKILMLTQWFEPEPIFKGLSFAQELVKRGHTVEVLTGFPNYPQGRLYPGYQLTTKCREDKGGIRVNRVWLYPSHDRSAGRRVLNYFSFAASASVLGSRMVDPPDVVYAYHPPGTIAIPAIVLRRRFGAPVVYDVQDLWPDTIATSGMMSSRLLLSAASALSRASYKAMDRIVVLSPGFKTALQDRGVEAKRIHVIPNWAEENALAPDSIDPAQARTALGLDHRFVVLFAGTMGLAQGLDTILDAAEICRTRVPSALFVLMGDGVERTRLMEMATKRQLDNVQFWPHRPISGVGEVMAAADLLLVHLRDEPLFRITIPSKTQAYMAAGKPLLMAVEGDAAELVRSAGAGFLARPGDPQAIADAVANAMGRSPDELREMGRAGAAYYRENLSLKVGVSRFESIFEEAIEERGRSEGRN